MIPNHIGIIMDGNRRFSKRIFDSSNRGHEMGAKKLEKVLEWCQEYKIKELTLYTFSMQNFSRPKEEFEYLMGIFRDGFLKLKKDKRIFENEIQVNVIGRLGLFPKDIQVMIKEITDLTRSHDKYKLNFAMAYGGREEIVDAAKKIAREFKEGKLKLEDLDETTFSQHLYLKDEPDMIIRTGGEVRTSNFLAYQGAYSEYIFLEKLWPEFEKKDFIYCLEEFSKRKRRYGN